MRLAKNLKDKVAISRDSPKSNYRQGKLSETTKGYPLPEDNGIVQTHCLISVKVSRKRGY